MNTQINFNPLGYLEGHVTALSDHQYRCIDSKADWNKLWNTIKRENVSAESPDIDFSKMKVIHINGTLSSISNKFLVKKIEKLADETLEIHCGEVCTGSGIGLASTGTSHVFVTINKAIAFKEIKTKQMEERRLEDFDEDLMRFQSESQTTEWLAFKLGMSLLAQHGNDAYSKATNVKQESEVEEIEGISDEAKEAIKEWLRTQQRFERVITQHSKQFVIVKEQLIGKSLTR